MNELRGCFGPDLCRSEVDRADPVIAVVVATVLAAAARVGAAFWFSMAGELPPAGDSSAASCRYALMNARFVVDMAGLTRRNIHRKARITGHSTGVVRLGVPSRVVLRITV